MEKKREENENSRSASTPLRCIHPQPYGRNCIYFFHRHRNPPPLPLPAVPKHPRLPGRTVKFASGPVWAERNWMADTVGSSLPSRQPTVSHLIDVPRPVVEPPVEIGPPTTMERGCSTPVPEHQKSTIGRFLYTILRRIAQVLARRAKASSGDCLGHRRGLQSCHPLGMADAECAEQHSFFVATHRLRNVLSLSGSAR